ncbi:MAG: hypothetical protein KGI28_08710 [Thaumarchaeota archaeon]|nr:hypothetical protein [Nitrososphaerota archaeon]
MKSLIALIFALCMISGVVPSFAQTASPGFTNMANLSDVSSDSTSPDMIVSSDGVFALWIGNNSGRSDVFFSKSTDGGNTFSTPINLSQSATGQSAYAAFAQKGNDVYVVWQTSLTGSASVFITKSSDGGTSFGKPVMLSDTTKLAAFPEIAISDNHVYSSWLEKSDNNSTNVVFVKSDDNANSFGSPLYVTHNLGNAGVPKLSATGNQVYLTWEDNSKGDYEIFLCKSDDSGVSFHLPVAISNTSGQSGTPEIFVSKDNVYAVWMDNTSGVYDILFAKSIDGGKSFGTPINISQLRADSGYPQLTADGNNVYVVWTQTISSQNYDIYFAKSTDSGDTFDTPINVSNNYGASGWPQVASDGTIYVSWVDSTPGKFDIFITKSTDGGKTFENYTDVSNSSKESYASKMSVLNNVVYLVWQEGNSGNHTIAFSKSTTFVPEFGPTASIVLMVSIVAIIAISFRSSLKLN